MLKILSNIDLCDRLTKQYEDVVVNSGVAGSWVTINSSNKFTLTTTSGATGLSYVIWVESDRDGTVGFSPDVVATAKITALHGPLRAVTDQVTDYAGLSVGDALAAGDSGKLEAAADTAAGAKATVAYVARKLASVTHLGTTYSNCIEFHVK